MIQLTKEQAIELAESKVWEKWTDLERAEFQLQQECLCMPFDVFQTSLENVLGRGVFTTEFIHPQHLLAELRKEKDPPTLEETLQPFFDIKNSKRNKGLIIVG